MEIEEADVEKHRYLISSFRSKLADTEENYHKKLSQLLGIVKDYKLQNNQLQVSIYFVPQIFSS